MSIYGAPLCAMLALSCVISVGGPTEEESKFDGKHLAFLGHIFELPEEAEIRLASPEENWFDQIAETWGLIRLHKDLSFMQPAASVFLSHCAVSPTDYVGMGFREGGGRNGA